ncbi:hypothetical protein A2997_02070 [Candidatus Nomurabacteria bacterium RIFCSPLOWO2_01_FULL_36_10b]|uniref:Uncharacterized protein n=1 Tax=Candidatus Nomurabacteria bacterium RIFCSPLOWO2_01_FULL_36_10b TaxID=1801766 RepID=A0A1F6WPB4_9BACT|nr:MAG: hypothetical protein A2997_02070 [Candidatus Nomurabacteria bacterium RIFCSPLOWO2_01_FULL_36_10b]
MEKSQSPIGVVNSAINKANALIHAGRNSSPALIRYRAERNKEIINIFEGKLSVSENVQLEYLKLLTERLLELEK